MEQVDSEDSGEPIIKNQKASCFVQTKLGRTPVQAEWARDQTWVELRRSPSNPSPTSQSPQTVIRQTAQFSSVSTNRPLQIDNHPPTTNLFFSQGYRSDSQIPISPPPSARHTGKGAARGYGVLPAPRSWDNPNWPLPSARQRTWAQVLHTHFSPLSNQSRMPPTIRLEIVLYRILRTVCPN